MNYQDLKTFADEVAIPRMREIMKNTQIPEGLRCVDGFSVRFLDGRSCGADYHITASGYVYRDGVVEEYEFDEVDVSVAEFVEMHKDFVFISEGDFSVEDELREMKAETKIGSAVLFAPIFTELADLAPLNVKWNYLLYAKMEDMFNEQFATAVFPDNLKSILVDSIRDVYNDRLVSFNPADLSILASEYMRMPDFLNRFAYLFGAEHLDKNSQAYLDAVWACYDFAEERILESIGASVESRISDANERSETISKDSDLSLKEKPMAVQKDLDEVF